MLNKTAIYKEVIKNFDMQRTSDKADLNKRRKTVYKAVPRIEEIDNEINLTGIKIAKQIMSSPDESGKFVIELKNELNSLKTEKNNLLKANNFPKDYLEMRYRCEKCKDTGFIGNKECSCFTQMLVDKAYSNSNIREIAKKENFDNFNINLYSPVIKEKEGISPRENIQRILAVCVDFTKNFGCKKENLLFYGKPGLGKTFLCSSIAKELLDKGVTVLYLTAPEMFRQLEDEKFSRKDEYEKSGFLDDMMSVDLLIIDDLGTEFPTAFTNSELFDILNTRMISKKPVIVSTNLEISDIQGHYSDRVTSRIIGVYRFLKFIGDDIRVEKRFSSK
ncbi:MAG: ATP-binding protein [Clostridia bacterium]|jgi:DNA replication protein DnaC|nr:ATP-binding protein [Clostridia bacterium]MCI1999284.1 ATP-binding protein [Clostridia bacterium]MCI2014763.1 ATP-binding protein [Clostridia bacterium]